MAWLIARAMGPAVECNKSYGVSFAGGLAELKTLNRLREWIASLRTYPGPVIFDWKRDVKMYYDFVPTLSWLKEAPKRAEALKEAFVHLYCQ